MPKLSDNQVTKLASLVLQLQDFVERLQNEGVKLTPEQQTYLAEMKAKRLCLVCKQPLEGEQRRGSHQSCYNGVLAQINTGKITTQQAVDDGVYNPIPDKPGRKGKYTPDPVKAKTTASEAARLDKKQRKSGTKDGTRKS